MGACLAVMALAVFVNVVLRYGFGSGVPASEELSRLLFVWMVFIGATAAYPLGEHMAFTSLVGLLQKKPALMAVATVVIRLLVVLACVLVARGAWQQVVVGLDSHSVVLGYPTALLPLARLFVFCRHRPDGAVGADSTQAACTLATAQTWSELDMTPEALAFVVFVAGMLVLMGIGMNMALALVLTGAGMAWVMDFWDTQLLAQNLVAGVDSFPLLAVPFFILAGELMNSGGISRRIIDMAQAWVGHIRGGLGYVAIGAAVLMASMSGSALADTAALATILLPMMRQQGYPMATSAGAGGLGRHHRAHHPAVHAVCDLRRDHQHLDFGAVHIGHRARHHHGCGAGFCVALRAARPRFARWPAPAHARAAARHGQGLLGAGDAHHHHRRHENRHLHPHRGRRGGRVLRAGGGPVHPPRNAAARAGRRAGAGGQNHRHRHVPVCRCAGGQLHDHPGRFAQRAHRLAGGRWWKARACSCW
jgi:TRAP-type C4-dicarboxylate transport system permease small subunit